LRWELCEGVASLFTRTPERTLERLTHPVGPLRVERNFPVWTRDQQGRAHFESLFARIPQDWYRNNPVAQYEGYYASFFYSHFAAFGLNIVLEEVANKGGIDMAVRFNEQVYLFEFKVVELIPAGSALAQLKARGYAEKYRALAQPIHLIGVEFSKETRTVAGGEVESS